MGNGFCPTDTLDHNNQAIEFKLCFLGLKQFHPLSSPSQKARLPSPFSEQKIELLDRIALRCKVWNSRGSRVIRKANTTIAGDSMGRRNTGSEPKRGSFRGSGPQRMIFPHPLLRRNVAKNMSLLLFGSSHAQ